MKIINYKVIFSVLLFFFILTDKVICGGICTELAMGSRSFGLGQSATMSYSDILSAINNPANLIQSEKYTSSFYYSEPFNDTRNIGVGISLPANGYGTFGFSYFSFLLDNQVERDESGNDIGTFYWSQKTYVISYANQIYNRINFGFNAKWFNDKWGDLSQSNLTTDNIGVDVSFGLFPEFEYTWIENLGIGITLKNLIQLNEKNGHLPKEIRLISENGYKIGVQSIFLVINYSWFEDAKTEYQTRFHFGLEYGYDFVFFRAGYNDDILSFGTGVQYRFLTLDYGYGDYIKYGYFDNLHNFTLNVEF